MLKWKCIEKSLDGIFPICNDAAVEPHTPEYFIQPWVPLTSYALNEAFEQGDAEYTELSMFKVQQCGKNGSEAGSTAAPGL